MSGTFSIHNKPAVILFDSGATHSFISAKFGARLGLDFFSYQEILHDSNPWWEDSFQSNY